MTWLLLCLLTAFSESLKDVLSKRQANRIDVYLLAWGSKFFSLVLLIPMLFFIEVPTLFPDFWIGLIASGSINVLAVILYMKALESSDISVSIPMITLTPVFLLITSPLIVGEFPPLAGIFGIMMVVTGSYLLNIGKAKSHWLAPFRSLISERGPRLMLMVAFVWSISSNFDKYGVRGSSPLFWSAAVTIYISLVLTIILIIRQRRLRIVEVSQATVLLPIGAINALSTIFQMTALPMTLVAYVISIKRTSAIMSVVWGRFYFKESGFKNRLVGVTIMVAGVVIISLL